MLAYALIAAAVLDAARGESTSAVERMGEFEQLAPQVDFVPDYLPLAGRVCARTGELAPLERLLDAASDLDPRLDRFVSSGRAILAEARSEYGEAESLYARAEQGWKEHDSVVERAYALLGLGRCRLAAGRSEEAAPPLREAREIFEKLGARPLVAEADELLAPLLPAT